MPLAESPRSRRAHDADELCWRADGRTVTKTIRGSKRDAQAALRAALSAVDRGEHVKPSKLTVSALLDQRIAIWRAEGRITARTAETYAAAAKLIGQHLGQIHLQRLTTRDVEGWHGALRARGLAASTIRKATHLLGHALADALRHNLVVRNVAREQGRRGRRQHASRS